MNHIRRVVGHVSGWQEQMPTCVCGKEWPCPEASPAASEQLLTEELVKRLRRENIHADNSPSQRAIVVLCDHWLRSQAPSRRGELPDVDTLAQIIRRVDGNHSLGAGALAEAIVQALNSPKGTP